MWYEFGYDENHKVESRKKNTRTDEQADRVQQRERERETRERV